ncbi:MAG: c-type cytochrome [Gloeobacteraceae cyanobacterium ES-bin-144]|nr:c-type cytochrome [Verrucomicrobiales bacterium]
MFRITSLFFTLCILVLAQESKVPKLVISPALAGATIPPGTTLKIEADFDHQRLTSPTALAFDSQGRILITETHRFGKGVQDDRSHLYWYLDDLAAKTTRDRRALHQKWYEKLPLADLTANSEIVQLYNAPTGDGMLEKPKVFADGFNDVLDGTAAGVFEYEGTIYLGCIPKLLMLRDTNGDGKSDERKTIEEGFGVRISLSGHDLNGFTLGPDGRIYGTIGDRGFSLTTKEGVVNDYPNQGAVFRFEPDGTHFEVIHTGLRNPKEIAFDALGYPFTVDNNSDQNDAARIVYIVEGGDSGWEMEHQTMFSFHRQIGLETMPPSRWMDEKIWHLANPVQPAFIVPPAAHLTSGPSGLTYHPGTGFLASEAGRFLICDYRGSSANSGIHSFEMKPDGAGMKMTDARKAIWGVAATDVEYSWDGKLFITDFEGGWKSHDQGRLLSLNAGSNTWRAEDAASTARLIKDGFNQRSSAELANLLRHPDSRIRIRAQIALTRKEDALQRFTDATNSSDFMARIHGIWGLGILTRIGPSPLPFSDFGTISSTSSRKPAEKLLGSLLADKNEEIRCQALRTLIDSPPLESFLQLAPLLADSSPRVRYFTTILIGKRKMLELFDPVCEMIHENDNRDPLLRHAGAYALQHISPDSKMLSAITSHPSASVRLAAVVALRRMKSPDVVVFIQDADQKVSDEAIRAICDLDLTTSRPVVATLLDDPAHLRTPFMLRRILHNSFRLGGAENAARILSIAANPSQPEIIRTEAFRLLSEWTKPFPVDQFTGHWNPLPERDPQTIIATLKTKLPDLLNQKDLALTAALELIGLYKIELPELQENRLREFVTDSSLPIQARIKALNLVIQRSPADLVDFLSKVIPNSPDELAVVALDSLAKKSPDTAITILEAALTSDHPLLAKKSWPVLATMENEAADRLFVNHLDLLRSANAISPYALELIDAAKQRKAQNVVAALSALEKSLTESSDPLAKWNMTLQGGDATAGRELFVSHPAAECMRCHRLGESHDIGGMTAPSLEGIANRHSDPRYFLESMLTPSAVIAPGFGVVSIDFKNGTSLNGNLIATAKDHLDLEANGKSLRINRSDITTTTNPTSPMPPMAELLNPSEMRDIIAWLASLKEDNLPTPAEAEPELFDPATLAVSKSSGTSIDPAVLKSGRTQYIVCSACHGQNGEGTGLAPPLAGSEWVTGPPENLIRIQLRGLHGPISVKGKTYDYPVGMTALAYQTDSQIADVITYVRNSFGNSAPPVTPAQVAALRSEVGKPQLTVADLVPLASATSPSASPPAPAAITPNKYDQLRPESKRLKWIVLSALVLLILCIFVFSKRDSKAS